MHFRLTFGLLFSNVLKFMAKENKEIGAEQNAGAAASQAVKTKRDIALEKLKARHPDTDYPDDEAIYGAIGADYDEDQKALAGYRENEKRMSDMMQKDPRNAAFLKAMMHGDTDPVLALVEEYGDDFLDYLSDPENQDKLNEARKKNLEKIAKSKELDKLYKLNIKKSLDMMDQYDAEHGEEATNDALTKYAQDVQDYLMGNIKKETLDTYRLAASHDADVEEAAHVAEVRGTNEGLKKQARLRKKGDGTPDLEGGGSPARDERKKMLEQDLGALETASSRPNIYEAGGFKRIRRS